MADRNEAIVFNNVNVVRGSEPALIDVSCTIEECSFTIVFGPNGAGKSTFLQVITDEIQPQSGTVRILGRSPKEAARLIGYVPQFFQVRRDFPLTVFEAVSMGLYSQIGPFTRMNASLRDKVTQNLHRLGVEDLSAAQVSKLSGGQLQRVMIARALTGDPKILLLDEATSGIDVGAKESLFELLVKLKRDITVLFVTHDVSVVSREVDCILCLNRNLVSHGAPEVALSDDAIRCMYGEGQALFSHCHTPHVHVQEHKR